jgi:methyl-CpG-binding domain protein 4
VERINIIQEEYANDPWKVLVCCILLNQTSNKQVRPLIANFFIRWPNPESVIREEDLAISSFIKTTGFQNIKAKRIKDFSNSWNSGIRDPFKFPGIGNYGREAWRIFIQGDTDFVPNDKKLKMYLESV